MKCRVTFQGNSTMILKGAKNGFHLQSEFFHAKLITSCGHVVVSHRAVTAVFALIPEKVWFVAGNSDFCNIDLASATVRPDLSSINRATMPDTSAAAMELPDIKSYVPCGNVVSIFSPGAVMI